MKKLIASIILVAIAAVTLSGCFAVVAAGAGAVGGVAAKDWHDKHYEPRK